MSVKENMSLTALRYFSRSGGSLKHAEEQQAVSDFIRLFNIKTPSMEQPIGLLSGSNNESNIAFDELSLKLLIPR